MKTAIIHDVYLEFGGAERVLLVLLEMFPKADVFIPLINKKGLKTVSGITRGKIITSIYNKIPFIHSASILLKPLLFLYWEQLYLNDYDLVISSSHLYSAKLIITSPDTFHLSYIHTPPKYLYTEYNETRILKNPFFKILFSPLLSWLRTKDFLGGQRPDILVANSQTTQKRIRKYYRRKSQIIYPPVSIPKNLNQSKNKKRYFLSVSRLSQQKGLDLAIKSCNKLKLPLVIVGQGSCENYLKSIAGPTIKFKGFVEDKKMPEIYKHAKALIYCSIDEDFGIVPVEAMAHGVPVIAYNSGAVSETVVDGKTGLLFDEYQEKSLIKTINKFNEKKFSSKLCQKQAMFFSKKKFITKLKKAIASYNQ